MARVDLSTQLTAQEVLVLQAITDGSYFVYRITPSGTIDGSNNAFTLPSTPNPPESLCLTKNGQDLTLTEDYSLSGDDITFVTAPDPGDKIRASYTVDPN